MAPRKRSKSEASSSDSVAPTDEKVIAKGTRAKRALKKPKTPASSGRVEAEPGPDLMTKPLSNLREIMKSLLQSATKHGLDQYVNAKSQFYLRVGTVCSGTDAPLHVLKLFGMLKNNNGEQVFTTINSFACEIEPFKQAFLERNSKPNLLFRDARDFSKDKAEKAHLVSGVEVEIPEVDIFVAGTSCVDFSSLNSDKKAGFAGLRKANAKWKKMLKEGGAALTAADLDPADWFESINNMNNDKNTSTTTFAGAINYIKCRQPKIVIFENVETAPWESTKDYVFPLCGYTICILKLDTKHYYLPQTRSRKYVVGFSHGFFGTDAAQALCDSVKSMMPELKHPYSSSVTDFLFPNGSLDLHRGRNEMELASLLARERDVNWHLSRGRHRAFRKERDLGQSRPWIRWKDNGSSNAPDKMWKPWESRQTNRVSDLLECAFLVAVKGKNVKHQAYDPRYKAQIIDCSQNVDRVNLGTAFGATGCLTPNAIPVLTLEARPITGSEALKLQGMPIENFNMSIESQAQLQDLAGNAMTTTVVGATLLAALASVAKYSSDNKMDWLAVLFSKGTYEEDDVKDHNSFEADVEPTVAFHDHPASHELNGLVLCAHSAPESTVSEILRLGNMARRRCVCYHILAYSSMELYFCEICGASLCKSCKGNPNHKLEKLRDTFDDLGCLSVAAAEDKLRVFFPSILPMESGRNDSMVSQISDSLHQSTTYLKEDARILADAVVDGICSTTYELKFIEITDIVRIEYVSKDNFILRVIIEKDEIIWYLHLDQWSTTGQLLGDHKTGQAIARAVVGPEAISQFPLSWQLWVPRKVEFDLVFAVDQAAGIKLSSVSDLQSIPGDVQKRIQSLKGAHWTKHEECGFPESALWVTVQDQCKMFLFKDVNPIGSASKDEFVITSTSREMGRTPEPESRQVLLRIKNAHQIHQIVAKIHFTDGAVNHNNFKVTAFVNGWFLTSDEDSVQFPQFSYNLVQHFSAFPASPPAWLRRRQPKAEDALLARHTELDARHTVYSCDDEQYLLTMSLPVFGASQDAVDKVIMTLRDFDLSQPLDLAEFARQIGPSYFAVEREILNTLGGSRVLQLWNGIKLSPKPCETCAPKLPTMFWKKPKGTGSRSLGPLVADCAEEDQRIYDANLSKKPVAFRIDFNVERDVFPSGKKLDTVSYVDVRFVGRAHTLLAQASSQLPKHPDFHHKDDLECNGAFSMEFGVLEDPRPDLEAIRILQPKHYENDPRQPEGFRSDAKLFREQLASLEWMLSRENDQSDITFTEREVSEVYVDHLRFRAFATASRKIVRRGRVVADNVGFGKTAVCLGLIARQWENNERTCEEFRSTTETEKFNKLVPLAATLIIVPNQLTQQWKKESERFLNDDFTVCVIQTFADLRKKTFKDLQKARIIVCSNKVFQDPKYQDELLKFCDSKGLDLAAAPKVYRAWYKQMRRVILPEILDEIRAWFDATATEKADRLIGLESAINETREKLQADYRFIPPFTNIDKSKWSPKMLLEYFSFSRIIWDEFPYKNMQVTEFVAEVPTISKWMLSGTPPLESLGDIANIAYLFNVHLAKPLALVGGRQPRVCENPPLQPLEKLEEADLYQSRNSTSLLKERHEQGLAFVRKFMRKNDRDTQKGIESIAKPLVLSLSTNARVAYLALQQGLRECNFNANAVGANLRRRLMGRVDWKDNKLGAERAMEALSLRASSSFTDVRTNLGTGVNASPAEVALKMYQNAVQDVEDAEDRGRELFGKAVNLAWRLAHINLKNHTVKADNGETRHNGYYTSLKEIVDNILTVDIEQFSGWDAYKSALRILIWDDDLHRKLGPVDHLSETSTSDMPVLSDTEAWAEMISGSWEKMAFCPKPMDKPKPLEPGNLRSKEEKEKWLDVFAEYLTKTPLHSRRWYLINNLDDDGLDLVKEILEEEWHFKVCWELNSRNANNDDTSDLVPIRELREPATNSVMDMFDVDNLKRMDADREVDLSAPSAQTLERVAAELKQRVNRRSKPSKEDWAQECTRLGLIFKSQESILCRINRIGLAVEDKASEEQYINSDGCRVHVMDLPLEGKQRIRGGNMEVIFDHLMHDVDSLNKLLEHMPEKYGNKNLMGVISLLLSDHWRCRQHPDDDACQSHYVSLACGHVHCSFSEGRVCSVRGCTQVTHKDNCITLGSLIEETRTINTDDFDEEALVRDPGPYLNDNIEERGPKALSVAELIKSMPRRDQVVVFVQNQKIMDDVYEALRKKHISFVTPEELRADESEALEMFKRGLTDAYTAGESDADEESGAGAGFDTDKKSRGGQKVAARMKVSGERKVLVQLINSEQAAGSNLHNANHVVFVSPLITRNQTEWDAQMKQALGRCVRFRQTKKVFVYHLVMDRTVEVDTLEWRMKQEILVSTGRAFGDFTKFTIPEFLERFDKDEERGIGNEGRATSMLSRDDVQYLMGDDYISVTSARSTKTVQSAKIAGDEANSNVEMSDA